LSGENTPTLCHSIPAFRSLENLWNVLAADNPEWEELIQPGINKLQEYEERLPDVHILAMGEIESNSFWY
jgi:hypothetical protein